MKCQCENALCSHHKGAIEEAKRTSNIASFVMSLKGCNKEATHTVHTHYGKYKMCDECTNAARDFATHIYKGV